MKINLFFSKSKEVYYWTGSDECMRCQNRCKIYALLLWDYWQHNFLERIFCLDCSDQILKAGGKYKEFKQVVISYQEILPADAEGVWPERPSLTTSKGMSVFDVATMPVEGVKTIDRTSLLARQSIWDAQIGQDMKAYLEEKDKPLQFEEGLAVLEDLKRAKPIDNKIQIEEQTQETPYIETK